MPPQAERNQIVSNAARLLRDPKFLVDNQRYPSLFALSVLAFEEIGKVVLELWGFSYPVHKSGKRPSPHLRKQAAVSSLLLAQYTTKELGDLVSSGPATAELIESVSRAMYESEEGKFVRLVGVGAGDKTKQIAFYRDDWLESAGLHADQFDASDVTQLFEKCRAAIAALGDSKTMHVGRAIWRTASCRRLERMTAFHMWTAPSSQGYFGQCSDQIACVHMSGLFSRSHMNAGQDGFREASSKHPSDLWRPVESTECLASWIDRSHHLLVALQVLASAQHGCS